MCVLLAMEAPQTLLDPPLAAVPFAQLARIKLLLVIVHAPLALLDTQPLQQEVLLSRLALSALLDILAHHRLQIRAVLHSLRQHALPASLQKLEPQLIQKQVLVQSALLDRPNLLQEMLHHVHLVLLALIKLQQVRHLALSAQLASTALLQDKYPSRQAVLAHALLDTQRQEQARRLSRIAAYVMLAMEAPHRLLVAPLADATLAHLGHLKLLQVIVNAHLVLPVTQPLQQEVLLPHLVVSVLLAILAL